MFEAEFTQRRRPLHVRGAPQRFGLGDAALRALADPRETEAAQAERSRAATTGTSGEPKVSMREIFWSFLELGWLAFGALTFCHLLPGAEALQLAIYVGCKRAAAAPDDTPSARRSSLRRSA
jgi:hypothetical protein